MKRIVASCLFLALFVGGCGEEKITLKTADSVREEKGSAPAESNALQRPGALPRVGQGEVQVSIKPENPVATDCLEAIFQGKLTDKTFVWAVNGVVVQQSNSSRYCLEGVRRDDSVSVTTEGPLGRDTDTVTVGNSPPRILDTVLSFTPVDGGLSLEITPEVEDLDGDHVELSYQWIINNQPNESYTENRLPGSAYQKADLVQVRIVPDDGYVKGAIYRSRDIVIPSATPVIISKPPRSFEAMEYTYQVEATDADGDQLTFKLESGPEGMEINATTGGIVWSLAKVNPGDYPVKVVVTDIDGNSSIQEFTLNLGERKIPGQ